MNNKENLDKKVEEIEGRAKILSGWQLKLVATIAFLWSLFQLWYASPLPYIVGFGVFIDVPARAIHLGFALLIAFLSFPFLKKNRKRKISFFNFVLAIIGLYCALYLFINYRELVDRNGVKYQQDSQKPYSGEIFDLYDNGNKKIEGSYKDGIEDGLWTYWYNNGQKKEEVTIKDGKWVSKKEWNEDGSVKE